MKGTWQTTDSGGTGLVLVLIAVAVLAGSGALTAIMHAAEVMVIVVLGGVFVAAVLVGTVAFLLARATARNAAEVGTELERTRPTRHAAAIQPPAVAPQPLAVTHNHYGPELHIHPGAEQDAARLIRQALTPDSPARITIPGHLGEKP